MWSGPVRGALLFPYPPGPGQRIRFLPRYNGLPRLGPAQPFSQFGDRFQLTATLGRHQSRDFLLGVALLAKELFHLQSPQLAPHRVCDLLRLDLGQPVRNVRIAAEFLLAPILPTRPVGCSELGHGKVSGFVCRLHRVHSFSKKSEPQCVEQANGRAPYVLAVAAPVAAGPGQVGNQFVKPAIPVSHGPFRQGLAGQAKLNRQIADVPNAPRSTSFFAAAVQSRSSQYRLDRGTPCCLCQPYHVRRETPAAFHPVGSVKSISGRHFIGRPAIMVPSM